MEFASAVNLNALWGTLTVLTFLMFVGGMLMALGFWVVFRRVVTMLERVEDVLEGLAKKLG